LPLYRGAAPVQRALQVSVFPVNPQILNAFISLTYFGAGILGWC